jgi:hypothetical protein
VADELDTLTGRPWLVDARNCIQSLMLELYERYSPSHGEEQSRRWQLCVGATFSLWRAVFLIDPTDSDRETFGTAEKGHSFLRRVIDTNNIGFGDDWANRDWSSGYYMNNVRLRLNDLCSPKIPRFEKGSLRLAWNRYYRIVQDEVRRGFSSPPENS